MLRLRQAVLAAGDLDGVALELSERLALREPFADPGVGHFGLRNAVFCLGDTFLEVVSPVQENTAAGRLIERRGGDCGYMTMFQLDDLEAARERARNLGVREVFEVALDDMAEVHLHPADMRGAIVSLSQPSPPGAWRWGGPEWAERSAPIELFGATIEVADREAVAARWETVLGAPLESAGIEIVAGERERGLVEIVIGGGHGAPFEAGGVRFSFNEEEKR
ncbi:MAG TPA: VOC family protein [Solirubrobacteraceae bacterium]